MVLAFALVSILDRPATRSGGVAATASGTAAAEVQHASSGFDGALLPGGAGAPNFTLTDQHGRRVSLGQYRGRVVDPHLPLPRLPAHLPADRPADPWRARRTGYQPARTHPPHPVPVLIVSTDPAADTPAAVRRFLGEAALSGRVEYLTGTLSELRPVWRAYGIVPSLLGDAASPHAASVLLIDRSGQKRDLFQVEQLTPEGLAHDVRKLEEIPPTPDTLARR